MTITYGDGYQPELLGWCLAQHGRYYAREWGFGAVFEAKIATDMAGFLRRLDSPRTHLFWARQDERFLGTLALDAGTAESGLVQLRWFITDEKVRGTGVGQTLMENAIKAARSDDVSGIFLHTFKGLTMAQKLYERYGLKLVREHQDTTWGVSVQEQRYELRF